MRRKWLAGWLPFLPSIALGLLGGVWLLIAPPDLERRVSWLTVIAAGTLVAGVLLAGSWLLERICPSYRHGSRVLERALIRLRLPRRRAGLLAAATAAGEELLFRGVLLAYLGVWGQALLFGALHPIDLRSWAYTLYTALAGVLFGYLTLHTGTLWAAILAHFLVNIHGLMTTAGRRGGRPSEAGSGDAATGQ